MLQKHLKNDQKIERCKKLIEQDLDVFLFCRTNCFHLVIVKSLSSILTEDAILYLLWQNSLRPHTSHLFLIALFPLSFVNYCLDSINYSIYNELFSSTYLCHFISATPYYSILKHLNCAWSDSILLPSDYTDQSNNCSCFAAQYKWQSLLFKNRKNFPKQVSKLFFPQQSFWNASSSHLYFHAFWHNRPKGWQSPRICWTSGSSELETTCEFRKRGFWSSYGVVSVVLCLIRHGPDPPWLMNVPARTCIFCIHAWLWRHRSNLTAPPTAEQKLSNPSHQVLRNHAAVT